PSDASHTAISSGDWSDPSTWEGGRIPDAGADVYIPQGIAVRYDVNSDAELHFVRVDGGLHFATDVDTRMEVDTLLTDYASHLTIGTAEQPVEPGVQTEIVIVDNGAIDLSVDPSQLSRGVVTHGVVEIHGAAKAPYLKLAVEPEAGDTTLTLEGDVGSWQVGDSLVVMGTQFVGDDSDGILQTQDEEVTIVAIDAATGVVTIDRPLSYDHTTPDYVGREGLDNELSVYVGNSSRNVTISSENPEGVRGHVMFMHNPNVEVRYAEFDELGRTDKSLPINTNEVWDDDDISGHNGATDDMLGTARNPGTENVEGRYALHIHRAGAEEDAQLAVIEGNSVTGSPGWGIVHHDSHAAIDYNFVYGVAGAGIVSEDANETGQWIGNFVTSTVGSGRDPDRKGDANILTMEESGDFGIDGIAFESQARQIIQQDNIAANSKTAWMFNTSETSTQGADIDVIQFDGRANPFEEIDRLGEEDASVVGFSGNQIIATGEGIFTGHRIIDNQTDIQQQFFDLTVYNVDDEAIIFYNYTNEYVVKDSLFVNVGRALRVGDKVEGVNLSNIHVEDAYEVAEIRGRNTDGVFVDVTYADVRNGGINGLPQDWEQGDSIVRVDLSDEIRDSADHPPVEITFKADADADLTITSGASTLNIKGELTDSVGTFNLAGNLWIFQERFEHDGIVATVKSSDHDYILEKYGAIRTDSGGWELGFFWWVGDRQTGENQAVHIPLKLTGFEDSYLEQFEISEFVAPSSEVQIYYENGIQSFDQDFENAVSPSNPGSSSGGSTGDDGSSGGSSGSDGDSDGDSGGDSGGGASGGTDSGSSSGGSDDGTSGGSSSGGSSGGGTDGGAITDGGTDGGAAIATSGDDMLYGGSAAEVMSGLDGDDMLMGRGGDDTLYGDQGDDIINGGAGADVLRGGGGADELHGKGGQDHLNGGGGADEVYGNARADTLVGRGGADELYGGGGGDLMRGNGAADTLDGGRGADVIKGGAGADLLFGGNGADTMVGGGGDDTITGGNGADEFLFLAGQGGDIVTDFTQGVDVLSIRPAGSLADLAITQVGDDVLINYGSGQVLIEDASVDAFNDDDFIF
ncbi:MAG: G8 domain-containing protein, partial [Pseudomonadota bacterium]